MKKEIGKGLSSAVLAIGLMWLGGCAAKNGAGAIETVGDGTMLERHFEAPVNVKRLKRAVLAAAKAQGWMTTPLGERRIVAEKYFNDRENIAAVVEMESEGYTVELSSAQGVSESKAKGMVESLAEAIEEALKSAEEEE